MPLAVHFQCHFTFISRFTSSATSGFTSGATFGSLLVPLPGSFLVPFLGSLPVRGVFPCPGARSGVRSGARSRVGGVPYLFPGLGVPYPVPGLGGPLSSPMSGGVPVWCQVQCQVWWRGGGPVQSQIPPLWTDKLKSLPSLTLHVWAVKNKVLPVGIEPRTSCVAFRNYTD